MTVTIGRRELLAALGGTAVAWPFAVRAQQPAMPVIGFLSNGGPNPRLLAAFREGLAEAGYVEGRNVTVEYRWANTQEWRLGELAADPQAAIGAGISPSFLAKNSKRKEDLNR